MIDIHCHILPGIDDGARDGKEALRMARVAADDGVSHIVATPHLRETLHPGGFLEKCVAHLNCILHEKNVPVEVLCGAEAYALLAPEKLKDYTINHTRYILIEFPYTHIPSNAGDILFNLSLHGLTPIITHPERIPSVIRNPDALLSLLSGDVHVQITAGSLTGGFGSEARECARYLLQKGAVRFIASDAHSADFRRPVLSKALRVAEKIVGKEKARMLVEDNPLAVISGKPL
ncbi:MAG: phosphotransferase [Proteobacteria bacterium]|nr:phosphotransferase [Pseudomonadota bacterium]